jgi:predicted helicase
VVYTPNEIVRFMIEGADWLCEKHFGKNLIDRDVEILDPATGTGTFICELLEHFRGQPDKLRTNTRNELHANEVAILPYYVANLNIEATYAAITGAVRGVPEPLLRGHAGQCGGPRHPRRPPARPVRRLSDENVEAHQAPEQAQDQRHHRQPALQRQPAQRERQQQEPRIPGDRQAHQGDLHRRQHGAEDQALRHVFTLGVVTNRDDWVYDWKKESLLSKASFLKNIYDTEVTRLGSVSKSEQETFKFCTQTKWTRHLKSLARRGHHFEVEHSRIVTAQFRPFVKKFLYFDSDLNEMQYRNREAFDPDLKGEAIFFSTGQRGTFMSMATGTIPSLDMFLPNACQSVPRYRYTKTGERIDNITDWGLNKFKAHYAKSSPERGGGSAADGGVMAFADGVVVGDGVRPLRPDGAPPRSGEELGTSLAGSGKRPKITKDAIFAYCYAVLHDPVYREKYALNLKREFPRIPFYPDFAQWVAWGEALMAMHIGYEQVEPWPVERIDVPQPKRAPGTQPKPVLKSNPVAGNVVVDADTQITGIPAQAWDYRLGNRSAIDWVLDQHKEKKPRDPTIAAKFNTYRFADYKESMIDLLARVVRVSVDTVAITEAMKALDRNGWDEA